MATRQEIIDVLDALLKNRMTSREAYLWAKKEIPKTDRCEDPPSAPLTMVDELDPDPVVEPSGNWREELLLGREVLIRGIPCPQNEHGKAVQAYFMAYTPVVLCQIRKTEAGDRVLELIEEAWGVGGGKRKRQKNAKQGKRKRYQLFIFIRWMLPTWGLELNHLTSL